MDYKDLNKHIKSGEFLPAYLFYGEEGFVKKRLLDRICAAAVQPGLADLNITRFNEDAQAADIIAACETLPIFDQRRVVIYRDCPMLKTKGKDTGEKQLLEYLENLPPSSILIFYMYQKPDGRKALFKKLKPYAVEFKPLGERDIYSWLKADLKSQGYAIDAQAVDTLVFRVGKDMGLLVNEVEKARAYVYPETTITEEAICAVSTASPEADAFELIDSVLAGDFPKAAAKLDTILANGGAIQPVMGAVNYRLQALAEARSLLDRGMSPSAAAQNLKGPRFAASRTISQAQRYSAASLHKAIAALAEADYSVKSGRMKDRIALEAMLVQAFGFGS